MSDCFSQLYDQPLLLVCSGGCRPVHPYLDLPLDPRE